MHKILGVMTSLFLSQSLLAMDASDVRHQLLLKQAAMKQCQVARAYSEWLLIDTKALPIDQGLTDYQFDSEIRLVDVINHQEFRVRMTSIYSSQYDHEAKEWGQFVIQDISPCRQWN